MNLIKKIEELTQVLLEYLQQRDLEMMATAYEELETYYQSNFGDKVSSPEDFIILMKMELARLRYLVYGNFYEKAHSHAQDTLMRIETFLNSKNIGAELIAEANKIKQEIENCIRGVKVRHENMHDHRLDSRCCLCRKCIANKTGSHMVPNFLAHPSFSFDAEGKRFREALDHFYVNRPDLNCSFYGREVPTWRIEQMIGKEVSDEFLEKNINQLEFDNEFCSVCEDRWGVLETAYSQFYSGKVRDISPRLSYLFWLSVLYRMSLGSMGLQVNIEDEFNLRDILDKGICGKEKDLIKSEEDLGEWQYAIFKINGLVKYGDKGILGSYFNYPYVIVVNDLIIVFYSKTPTDEQLVVGPITIKREWLNTWQRPESIIEGDRRFFWEVRDWIDEIHFNNYDPPREHALTTIRSEERHSGRAIDDEDKALLIKAARLSHPNFDMPIRIRKAIHFVIADVRRKIAEEKGEKYSLLDDELVFLSEKNVQDYFEDLSEAAQCGYDVSSFPFYSDARDAIPDESKWIKNKEPKLPNEEEYIETAEWYFNEVLDDKGRKDQLRRMGYEFQEPIHASKIGRNDPCPCGSGKKYKKCHGRNI